MDYKEYFERLCAMDLDSLFKEFKCLVTKLKANEEKLGRDTLERRYADAYGRLKDQIRTCIKAITLKNFEYVYMPHYDYDTEAIELIKNKVYELINTEAVFEDAYNAAFAYNVDRCLLEEIGITLVDKMKSIYVPYFIARVVVDTDTGRVYSPLISRYRKNGRWVNENDVAGYRGYPASVTELLSDYRDISEHAEDVECYAALVKQQSKAVIPAMG